MKDLLAIRGILSRPNFGCDFCSCVRESTLHSLLCCHIVDLVWRDMAEWVGFLVFKVLNFKESFLKWFYFCKQAKVRKGKEGLL